MRYLACKCWTDYGHIYVQISLNGYQRYVNYDFEMGVSSSLLRDSFRTREYEFHSRMNEFSFKWVFVLYKEFEVSDWW